METAKLARREMQDIVALGVLTWPENEILQKELAGDLESCKRRLVPGAKPSTQIRTLLMIPILECLCEKGRADPIELHRKLAKRYRIPGFSVEFKKAWEAIAEWFGTSRKS